ncbi:hypothetical protein BMS3Abin10_02454 [bacterium BMS3Abin10]|nr:hypothetical protein BMS3Abin10_02454 [bacterium BMS3Abin10]HDZ62634.1 hypothetical protein [Nitrospirota bacterium]
MKKYILTGLILFSFLAVLSSCGGGAVDAPVGTVISIDPSTYSGDGIIDQTFTVTVKDENGVPLNDVIVYISSSSTNILLYDSSGDPTGSTMNAGTDANGVYNLNTYIYGGDYTAQLEFRSGSAYESVSISVSTGG